MNKPLQGCLEKSKQVRPFYDLRPHAVRSLRMVEERGSDRQMLIIPLEHGDSFEVETPPKKRFEPKRCQLCVMSPGSHNTNNLEQELLAAKLKSRVVEDIWQSTISTGSELPPCAYGESFVCQAPHSSLEVATTTKAIEKWPSSPRKTLFVSFLKHLPFFRLCAACVVLCVSLALAGIFALQDGSMLLVRMA
ncbi:hypothetical protein BIW11_05829, partial [Tropilaelaps mercedesae]